MNALLKLRRALLGMHINVLIGVIGILLSIMLAAICTPLLALVLMVSPAVAVHIYKRKHCNG